MHVIKIIKYDVDVDCGANPAATEQLFHQWK
jgi:hypothetical protein